MSLLDDLKKQYDEQLEQGERVPIEVPGSKGKYFVVKGVITANRKNAIAKAFEEGPLAYAAAVIINSLRRESDGQYEFKGVTVSQLLRNSPAEFIDDMAYEIQKHVLMKSDDDDIANVDEVVVAKGNSKATPTSGQDST